MVKQIVSIGAMGYNGYPTYLEMGNKKTADDKKTNYKKRHRRYILMKGAGYYADAILW
jgi:hypothetical protein